MKTYDLDIQELREFEGGHMGWYSKGHHDFIPFLFAVAEYVGSERRLEIKSDRVRHEWWRCMPVGLEDQMLLIPAKPNTRGAFPVTVVEN